MTTPSQFFTLSKLGLDGAHIINQRTGEARPVELEDDAIPDVKGIWEWVHQSLAPGEVLMFGWHQAGTA
jgi:hypothetical protein